MMNELTALETAIAERLGTSREQAFAVLDFDNTCIVNDVGEAALAFICRNHLLRHGGLLPSGLQDCTGDYHAQVFRYYHRILEQGDIRGASLLCARIFAGFGHDEAAAVMTATLDEECTIPSESELYGLRISHGLSVRPVMRKLIDYCAARSIAVWIVSASPALAVEAAMQRFAIAGNLIALRHRSENGLLTPEIEEPCSIAEGKVDCIKAFIDASRPPLLAVGDSIYDLPMVAYAELPAVVERDNALTQEARRRGWYVLPS
jgi:phosphoserine phosphatase